MYNSNKKKRILIIDDEVDLANSLRDLFLDEYHEVDIAFNGNEGILFQRKNPYNLIITDIVMPEMDGIEVIIKVKESAVDTKIIAISGGGYFNSREYLSMALQLGASMAFTKPFSANDIKEAVNQLLNTAE